MKKPIKKLFPEAMDPPHRRMCLGLSALANRSKHCSWRGCSWVAGSQVIRRFFSFDGFSKGTRINKEAPYGDLQDGIDTIMVSNLQRGSRAPEGAIGIG